MVKLCPNCKLRPKKKHGNAKWCWVCANSLRKRPKSTMTKEQIRKAKAMIGKAPRDEIAQRLGVSVSNLKRAFRGTIIWFQNGKYRNRPELVREVLEYYREHGQSATIEAFPKENVRSITDRPEYYGFSKSCRQIRWTDEQIVELTKMAGIISPKDQARYFNRPGANEGSIRSVWTKRFHMGSGCLHGMSHRQAKYFVKKRCPYIQTSFWSQRNLKHSADKVRMLYLWVDVEKYLRADCPEFVRTAIVTIAQFQRWLFQSDQPKRAIAKIIQSREVS